MRVALLTTDNRGPYREFQKETPWFGMAPEALLEGFARIPELEIHIISCIREPVEAPEKLADNIWFHSLHVPRIGWMRTGYLGCLRAIRRRLKQIRPDLVHGQGSELEAAICAAYSGYPNVITLLGIMREMRNILKARPGSFIWFASLLEGVALRRTFGVLCNSRFTEEKLRGRTCRTWLVPNAIRDVFFSRPPPDRRPPGCALLNVGTVCSYKRQNELLDVIEQLHGEGLEFQFKFIGGASATDSYATRFLDRVKNRSYVSWHPFEPLAELLADYDQALALVHVSAIESFGLTVAEALSRNVKFFGFRSGGVADIVQGVNGAEAFADGDWAGLKAALGSWIRAGFPPPAPAVATMRERYHPLEIARQHLPIYREALDQHNRRG